jgi:hypothetical protein
MTPVEQIVDQLSDQRYAVLNAAAAAGDNAVAELVRNQFAHIQTVSAAVVANTLLNGQIPGNVLAERSAGGQPQSSAANSGVNSGGPSA